MSLPDFELGVHEYKAAYVHSSESLCAPATARFKIGDDWYLVRTCREAYQDDPIVFMRLDAPDSPIVVSYCNKGQQHLQKILKTPDSFLHQPYWRRRLVYETGVSVLTLDTDASRSATWQSETGRGFSCWNFPREVTLDWLLRDTDDAIRRETSKLLEDEASDCSFSWRWANLDGQERVALAHRTHRGTPAEFVHIIRCIIWHYCIHLMDEDTRCIIQLAKPNSKVKTKFQLYANSLRPRLLPNNGFPPENAMRCFELACSYFSLDYRDDWQQYSAIEQEIQHYGVRPIVSLSFPSHHERLEAHLTLRDFLRDKVSPTELAELMGE